MSNDSEAQSPGDFVARFKSLILATSGEDGAPLSSYAPFVQIGSAPYVFVSQLAQHTRNLLRHPHCHIMWLQDESTTVNLFARQRISAHGFALVVERDCEEFEQVMSKFRESFGPVVDMLTSLPDFILFRLEIRGKANWVSGFGKAQQVVI